MKSLYWAPVVVMFAGCARSPEPAPAPPPEPFKIVATAKQLMHAITIPASDAVWKVAGEPPKTDEGWQAVEYSALALAESGNLLLMKGRAKEGDEWTKYSTQLVEVGAKAAEDARAKDVDKMMAVGDELYTICENCHMKYMPQEPPPAEK